MITLKGVKNFKFVDKTTPFEETWRKFSFSSNIIWKKISESEYWWIPSSCFT